VSSCGPHIKVYAKAIERSHKITQSTFLALERFSVSFSIVVTFCPNKLISSVALDLKTNEIIVSVN
jgi:hypothetical protein